MYTFGNLLEQYSPSVLYTTSNKVYTSFKASCRNLLTVHSVLSVGVGNTCSMSLRN